MGRFHYHHLMSPANYRRECTKGRSTKRSNDSDLDILKESLLENGSDASIA